MRIEAIDIIQVRNVAVPQKNGKKLPVPDVGLSNIVQITARTGDGQRLAGLGEIRAMSFLTGETAGSAHDFAQDLGSALLERELPEDLEGWHNAEATDTLITAALRRVSGIAEKDPVPGRLHGAVRFGFDCALLDLLARSRGLSVAALLDLDEEAPVRRNVFSRPFGTPADLINMFLRGRRPNGWVRGRMNPASTNVASVLAAISSSLGGVQGDLRGIWFNLAGSWKHGNVETLFQTLDSVPILPELEVVLEQPFPSHASAWYADLCARAHDSTLPIRVMIGDDITEPKALERVAELLPQVDLRITPQRCGSLHGVRRLVEAAQDLGFAGRIYLGNAGMNTELNTLALIATARSLPGEVLFSADAKKIDRGIRQLWPQAETDEIDPCLLRSPAGEGWGGALCRSILDKRLRKVAFLRDPRITSDHDAFMSLLLVRAYDDNQLDQRQLSSGDGAEDDAPVREGGQDDETEA